MAPDFQIGPGDTLEIAVAGIPEMRQRVTVQPDGTIAIPLADSLRVAGLTASELRDRIRAQLNGKIYRQRGASGQDAFVVIRPEEVTASVLDFRPIYVTGAVRKPGEVTFRAGMSAQQAIALAGGYGVPGGDTATAQFDLPVLKAEFTAVWTDYTKALFRLARVQSELNDSSTLSANDPSNIRLPLKQVKALAELETKVLAARLVDYHKQKQSYQSAGQVLSEQSAMLTKLQKQEEEGAGADRDDLKKLMDLLARGQVTSTRVIDARRAFLLSSTRALQVSEELLSIRRQSEENARQFDHYESDRQVALLQESQQATLDMNTALTKQRGIEDKIHVIYSGRFDASDGDRERVEVKVTRKTHNNVPETLAADASVPLQPGDVVEVSLGRRDPAAMSE
ncbi:polysaccharide biosynthesis/export family protein [Beijerinckia sp. 28-YEA-48]|uniref:polysaccharide biosynthesis/export family protein n=2 Tax=unclassified Beijerinckia TaxID=2638183 RepID=UPI001AECEA7C|nr:polysaccharide biosynthesis/export family protein [Beijerinckia sp. 28-YEA-48]